MNWGVFWVSWSSCVIGVLYGRYVLGGKRRSRKQEPDLFLLEGYAGRKYPVQTRRVTQTRVEVRKWCWYRAFCSWEWVHDGRPRLDRPTATYEGTALRRLDDNLQRISTRNPT